MGVFVFPKRPSFKPSDYIQVDKGHPLCPHAAWIGSQRGGEYYPDYVRRQAGTTVSAFVGKWTATPLGTGVASDATSQRIITLGENEAVWDFSTTAHSLAVGCAVYNTGVASTDYGIMSKWVDASGSRSLEFFHRGPTFRYATSTNGNYQVARDIAGPSITLGKHYNIVCTYNSAVGMKIYSDGLLFASAAQTGTLQNTTASLGLFTPQSLGHHTVVTYAYIYSYAITPTQVMALHVNPYAIYVPVKRLGVKTTAVEADWIPTRYRRASEGQQMRLRR